MANKHTVWLAVRRSGQRDSTVPMNRQLFQIYRPNSGLQLRFDTFEEVKRKGKLVKPEKAAKHWNDMYEKMSRRCVHVSSVSRAFLFVQVIRSCDGNSFFSQLHASLGLLVGELQGDQGGISVWYRHSAAHVLGESIKCFLHCK